MSKLSNVENMSSELLECIMEYYRNEIDNEETKELVATILRYLYDNTTDNNLKRQISEIVSDLGYCLECGNKLQDYTYEEVHSEVPPPNIEYITETLCPCCDMSYIDKNNFI